MSTQQPAAGTPTPPDKPAVTVEEVAAELSAYLDEVDAYVTRLCTPEYIDRKRREIEDAAFGRANPPTRPDTC